jgi:hypothetical protein
VLRNTFITVAVALVLLAILGIFRLGMLDVPEPKPPHADLKPPPTASTITMEEIGASSKQDCWCPLASFAIVVHGNAIATYKEPPVVRFRITRKGVTEEVHIVRSSGSTRVDQDFVDQIPGKGFLVPEGCGGWNVTVAPSVEFATL